MRLQIEGDPKDKRIQHEEEGNVAAIAYALELELRAELDLHRSQINGSFIVGKKAIMLVPDAPDQIWKRSGVWFHEAEVATGFENPMNLTHGFVQVRMHVVKAAYD